jgi:serine/threonine protein kinase
VTKSITTDKGPTSIDGKPSFRFPLHNLTICKNISRTVKESEFRDVKYLCSGSNAYIYTATQNEEMIVVKMLKNKLSNVRVAELEMDIEMQLLAAIDHPNIIAIKGAGVVPRKFVVVEHLSTGTLANVLDNPSIIFKDTQIVNSRIPVRGAILIARELISALKYLHNDLSPIATVIHRG